MTTAKTPTALAFADIEPGDDLPAREIDLDGGWIAAHARAMDMAVPRFTDDEGARREGLPGQIMPGAMSIGLLASTLLAWAPAARLIRVGTTFRGLARAGGRARILGMVIDTDHATRRVECEMWMQDATSGDRLVVGTMTLEFPPA